ncbi:MAG: hypothetical protein IKQ27_03620 [Lachnospiraceae bacterium]|nr:hypothetical protein [Lachnospiraceae bacterium]MBR6156021.1 hypothetical protein [Lachnospiraceae bacterium]MBR6357152.1 hypothetical protein [Lachnospiraceae bacterium]
MIVADILTSYIEDSLKEINLGNGSIIGFVTENGREVIFENIPEGAAGTAAVNDVVGELVQNLNRVSETLDRNMGELKSEIAAFKTE